MDAFSAARSWLGSQQYEVVPANSRKAKVRILLSFRVEPLPASPSQRYHWPIIGVLDFYSSAIIVFFATLMVNPWSRARKQCLA
jgi:hypothetical protein